MRHIICWIGLGCLAWTSPSTAQDVSPKSAAPTEAVVRDQVVGALVHGKGKTKWKRVIGKATVIDARTLEFADGTRIELDIHSPDLEQMALDGEQLYPCGREAAEFLGRLVADRTVMVFQNGDGPALAYVGDVSIEYAMVVNGWALADHSSLHAPEVIARENKRGLWRGKFVIPDAWRAGLRLPGEPSPDKLTDEAQAHRLLSEFGTDEAVCQALVDRIVRDLPNIRSLNFRNCALTDAGLVKIGELNSLERLYLAGRFSDAGLAPLANLTQLTRLATDNEISAAGLAHIRNLTRLRSIELPWGRHTDLSLAQLANLVELESLTLGRGEFSVAGFKHLERMTQLRQLRLYGTRITDESLAHLSRLTRLVVLEFSKTRITDAGLVHLTGLHDLAYLDISDGFITDAGIERLVGLKSLRVLHLPVDISASAKARLVEAIPMLKFEGKPEDAVAPPDTKP